MTDIKAEPLSSSAVEVLGQLFVKGPTWDGNICSKQGRADLIRAGLALHQYGWAFLTAEGVRVAHEWDLRELKRRHYQGWYRKAATLD